MFDYYYRCCNILVFLPLETGQLAVVEMFPNSSISLYIHHLPLILLNDLCAIHPIEIFMKFLCIMIIAYSM